MTQSSFNRKLTTIFSADAVGYSKLMRDDEAETVKTIELYRRVMTDLITQHRGKVIDSPGDNLLADFDSVVDAVQCAVAVQKELLNRNAGISNERKMEFRIGINIGDIIQEGERIYGDGVNIAARLEGIADPGGICISKTAFDHIESKLPYGYDYMGEQTVKNIPKPIKAYRVSMEPRVTVSDTEKTEKQKPKRWIPIFVGIAVMLTIIIIAVLTYYFYGSLHPLQTDKASEGKTAIAQHEKPSIAVLPFDNISNDPDLDYLCDGITETLIATLSKVPDVFVIARNSTFVYKGKNKIIKEISNELGVQYVIEGSIQKFAGQLRIAIQMVDALTERHVLSETFDRNLEDLFKLQDEIILEILKSVEITRSEIEKGESYYAGETSNLDAMLKYLEANYNLQIGSKDSLFKAKQLFEDAINIDPKFAYAYMQLGRTYQVLGRNYSSGDLRKKYFAEGIQLAHKAIELDQDLSPAHLLIGISYLFEKKYDMAESKIEKAIELNPADPNAHSFMALCLIFSGKMEESIYYAKEAIRLDPLMNTHYFRLSRAFFHSKRYDDAIKLVNKTIELGPANPVFQHIYLAMIYGGYGRDEEARTHMIKVLEIKPDFNIEARRRTLFYKNPADADREIAALRKAGAPEHPPHK